MGKMEMTVVNGVLRTRSANLPLLNGVILNFNIVI